MDASCESECRQYLLTRGRYSRMSYGSTPRNNNRPSHSNSNGSENTSSPSPSSPSYILNDDNKGQDSIAPIIAGLGSGTICFSVGLILLETFKPAEWPTDIIGFVCIVFGICQFVLSLLVLHIRDYRNVIGRLRNRTKAMRMLKQPSVIPQSRGSDSGASLKNYVSYRAPSMVHFESTPIDALPNPDVLDAIHEEQPASTSSQRPTKNLNGTKVSFGRSVSVTSVTSSFFSSADSVWLDLADETDECMFECLMPGSSSCCGWLPRPFQHISNNNCDYEVTPRCSCEEV